MIKRRIGTISFLTTLALLMLAFAAGAGPNDPQDAKAANAKRVNAEFAPSVADPTVASKWIELGQGIQAQLEPNTSKEGYVVNVAFKRSAQAAGPANAAASLDLKCTAETLSPMGRIPVPMQVELGHEVLQVNLQPGQTLQRRVHFKIKPAQQAMMMARPVASITASAGANIVKDAVFVAWSGAPTRPQPVGLPGLQPMPQIDLEPIQQQAAIEEINVDAVQINERPGLAELQ